MKDVDRPRTWRHRMAASLLAASALCISTAVHAQAVPPAPQVEVVSKPLYLEWGITGAMVALAIFVVGRKSNRT